VHVGSSWLKDKRWTALTEDGKVTFTGFYLICDGGYLRWPPLICPHDDGTQLLAKYGRVITAARKDIECTFGSLKQRSEFLKNWNNLRRKESIDDVFTTCCILHNLNLKKDGYLDLDVIEMPGGAMRSRAR
jgi:hypothetical protein